MKAFVQTITTRGYELDADALISPATYLRYLEHLRWRAVADQASRSGGRGGSPSVSGHILSNLFGQGHSVVVVAQSLGLDGDVGQGVALTASMWVRRVGRTSLDFGHAILRPDGSTLARALVTAVYRGPDGMPTPVPEVVRQQVMADPTSLAELLSPAETSGRADEGPPSDAWSRAVEVRPSDIDLLGHVNHANYLGFFDDTRRLATDAGALAPATAGRLSAVSLEYRHQAVVGAPLVARVWPHRGEGTGIQLALDLHARETLLARAWITLR